MNYFRVRHRKTGHVRSSTHMDGDATGRIEHTQGFVFSADETADVGLDGATPVSTDYKEGENTFTGKILKVVVDIKPLGVAEKAGAGKALQEAKLKKAISD